MSTAKQGRKDLVVLVADRDQEQTVSTLLGRVDICVIMVICPHSPYLIHNGQK